MADLLSDATRLHQAVRLTQDEMVGCPEFGADIVIHTPTGGSIAITKTQGLGATAAGVAAFFGAKAIGWSLFASVASGVVVPAALVYWLGKKS
jgi:hypothetical protein